MFGGNGRSAPQALWEEELGSEHYILGGIEPPGVGLEHACSDTFYGHIGPYYLGQPPEVDLGLLYYKDILRTSPGMSESGLFNRHITPEFGISQGIGFDSSGSNEGSALSPSDHGTRSPSLFECSSKGSGDMTCTSDWAANASAFSNLDTPSDASFPSVTSGDPIDSTLDASNELLSGSVSVGHCTKASLSLSGPITCRPATRPQRKPKQPRSTCDLCERTFSRPSDMARHQRDIHEIGSFIYKCQVCKHGKFGRQDKVKAHCKKQEHGQVLELEVASNPEAVSAVRGSCRRQGVRPTGRET